MDAMDEAGHFGESAREKQRVEAEERYWAYKEEERRKGEERKAALAFALSAA